MPRSERARLALLLVLCTACGGAPSDPAPEGDQPSPFRPVVDQVQDFFDRGRIMGAELLILQDGAIAVHEAIGWQDRERGQVMQKETLFQLQSNTKPITATAVMMLIQEGALSLDDRVSAYLPSFDTDAARDITIRRLLTRTSGFTTNPVSFSDATDLRDLVDRAAAIGPDVPPGTVFARTGVATWVLGALVTHLSGMPVEEFIETRILDPLGMTDATTSIPLGDVRRSRTASRYVLSQGSWSKFWDPAVDPPQVAYFRASGGMFSTPSAYAMFLDLWLKGVQHPGITLDSSLVAEATRADPVSLRPEPTLGVATPYGFHWDILPDPVHPSFGHEGADGTIGWVYPTYNTIVVYFTQSRGDPTIFGLLDAVEAVLESQ